MITRRVSTKMIPGPPVRFYRTIAITFLVLTVALLAIVIFFTSKKVNIVIVVKSDNKNVDLSIEVSGVASGSTRIKGVVTSTLFAWTEKYYPTSNKVVDGLATGEVTIYNDSALDQPLVKTTRLLTSEGVLFRLLEGVLAPANSKVSAKVYADKAGSSGNIGPSSFIIPGLSEDRQKFVYAKSTSNMSGGVGKVGVLTANDLEAAKSDYLIKAKQAFLTASGDSQIADLKGKEKVVLIKASAATADKKVDEEIDSFNLSGTSTVVIVYYDKSELQSIISSELSKKIDSDLEKVLSVGKTPQVSLANYNLETNTARLLVYQDVLVTLDANGSKLAVVNFFDKTKDEIQRYIMGLNHVVGVETKFSPTWLRKAPSVTDRIKVVVKNVK